MKRTNNIPNVVCGGGFLLAPEYYLINFFLFNILRA